MHTSLKLIRIIFYSLDSKANHQQIKSGSFNLLNLADYPARLSDDAK